MFINPYQFSTDFDLKYINTGLSKTNIKECKRHLFIVFPEEELENNNSYFNKYKSVYLILINLSKEKGNTEFEYIYEKNIYVLVGFLTNIKEFKTTRFELKNIISSSYIDYNKTILDNGIYIYDGNGPFGPYTINFDDLFGEGINNSNNIELSSPTYYTSKQEEIYSGYIFSDKYKNETPSYLGSDLIDEFTSIYNIRLQQTTTIIRRNNRKLKNSMKNNLYFNDKITLTESIFIYLFHISQISFFHEFDIILDSDLGQKIDKIYYNNKFLTDEKIFESFIGIINKLKQVFNKIVQEYGRVRLSYHYGFVHDISQISFLDYNEIITCTTNKRDLFERAVVSSNIEKYADILYNEYLDKKTMNYELSYNGIFI
jgi:hypothetical protein